MKKKSSKPKAQRSKDKVQPKSTKPAVSIRNPKSEIRNSPLAVSIRNPQSEVRNSSQYSFFENVYDVARLIPKGRVTSYGAIARYLGSGRSARLVGYAMNSAGTQHPPVPAHRVLNRNGMLTGKHHFGTPDLMQKLLEKEGIAVKKDTVANFDALFWDPNLEL